MKLIKIKRTTKKEKRFSSEMGILTAKVTYVKKTVLNIPVKTLHKYRETYYGKIKDCESCRLTA